MSSLDVSIIIVNYNTIKLLIDAIDSIIEKTISISYEIIVVDNNSSDNSMYILSEKYDNKIICIKLDENIGFGRANNEGVRIARGRNVLFLNPDTKLLNNAIQILSNYLDLNESVGVCGGNLYDEYMNPTHSYRMIYPSVFSEVNDFLHLIPEKILYRENREYNFVNKPRNVAYITGADLMVKKNILNELGCFCPSFFMYYEDTELCYRVFKAGYQLVSIPSAKIQHLESKSFEDKLNYRRYSMVEKGRAIFYKECYYSFYKKLADLVLYTNILCHMILAFFLFDKKNYAFWKMRFNILRSLI